MCIERTNAAVIDFNNSRAGLHVCACLWLKSHLCGVASSGIQSSWAPDRQPGIYSQGYTVALIIFADDTFGIIFVTLKYASIN